MSLLKKIEDIRRNNHYYEIKTDNNRAWKRYYEIIKILNNFGGLQIPAPKTYITSGYISPSNCQCQIMREEDAIVKIK